MEDRARHETEGEAAKDRRDTKSLKRPFTRSFAKAVTRQGRSTRGLLCATVSQRRGHTLQIQADQDQRQMAEPWTWTTKMAPLSDGAGRMKRLVEKPARTTIPSRWRTKN